MTGADTRPPGALTGRSPTAGDRADRLAQARLRRQARLDGEAAPATVTSGPTIPRRPAGCTVLSSAQRRFWFVRQLDPGHDPFHIPVVVHLRATTGAVDTDRLIAAFRTVVTRHEVLRTRIIEVDGNPVPAVDPDPADACRVLEVTPAELPAAIRTAAFTPFDLAAEQPWRLTLLRTDPATVTLVASVHHVAFDGWSVGVLLDEIGAGYRGEHRPELPLQFADVAAFRETPEGREGSRIDHWRSHLADPPAALGLPTDRPRTVGTPPDEATLVYRTDPATVAALHTAMAGTGCTAFMVLLAAWHVVLQRWTGRDDVLIGTAVAGRTLPGTEPLIGCFVGTLALRTTSSPADSVRDLLTRVRGTVLDGLAHQHIGYEQVVEAVRPHRPGSVGPGSVGGLYDVSMTVHTEPGAVLDLPDIEVMFEDIGGTVAQNDIALSVHGDGVTGAAGDAGDVTVTAKYFERLFTPETVRRMLGHLDQVLREFAVDPDRSLTGVRMLTDAETDALDVLIGSDVPLPDRTDVRIEQLIATRAAATPDAIAVSSQGVDLSYGEMHRRALDVAAALVGAGVGPGDRVALFAERSCDAVVGLLGVWHAGAAYVPIDPLYPDGRIRQLLDGADVRLVLTQPALASRLPAGARTLLIGDCPAADRRPDIAAPADDLTTDAPAYVLFTSGTTGAPKGVTVEHRHLSAYLAGARSLLGFQDGWSWATMTTLSADLGLTNVLGALTTGGRLHLLTYQQVADPAAVADYFSRHRIDAMKLVPSHLQALWDDERPTAVLPRRLLVLAGEGLPWALVDRIRSAAPDLDLHNHYGPTETTVSTMGVRVAEVPSTDRREDRAVPLGRPFPGTRARVTDRAGRPAPIGVPGELVIAGPSVSRGYLGRPDLTAERFSGTTDPDHAAYRTGDRVRRLPSGLIEFLGRIDDQVKIRGYRVEPAEVATVIADLPGIAECVVVPRTHAGRDRLVAHLVAAPGAPTPDIGAVRSTLRELLPDYLVPADYTVIPAIPLSANGKVDRSALPEPEAGATSGERVAPSGPSQERVAAVWAAVLGVADIGADDDFFDLGGDSFATVKVVRGLDGAVSVVDVFGAPTVRSLAAVLDRRAAGDTAADAGLLRRLGRPSALGTTVPGTTVPGTTIPGTTIPGTTNLTIQLVCVPFGGGSPVAFAPLADALPDGFAVLGVDLPGHDTARPDDPCRPLDDVADALVAELLELPGDIVLYGHCLGGALAARTALGLEAAGRPVLGLIEAGTFPAARLPGRLWAWLHRVLPGDRLVSDRAYLETLRSLGGFTDELDPRDLQLLMTALRHDSREAESFYTRRYVEPEDERPTLSAPLLCVVGERDRSTQLFQERYAEWRDFADDVELAVIPGAGHFFARHQAGELAALVDDRVRRWRSGDRPATVRAEAAVPEMSVRTFLWVAITQLLSMIGTGLTSFALGIWVLQQTGSVTAFATISVMAVLPAILAMPLSGAIADRFDRRRVMLVADSVAGVMTGALVVMLAIGRLELWFIYLFAGLGALAGAFQRPAYLAAVTQLVPKRYLGQANGLVSLGINSGDLIAALAGGTLIGLVGLPGVVAVDVLTFLSAVTVIVLVRFPDRMFIRQEESFGKEITGGWRYIVARPQMVAMVVFFCLFNYLFTFPVTLVTPLLLANHSAAVLGAVMACGGLGAAAGAVAMAVWGGTRRRAIGMIGGTGVLGVSVLVLGASPHPVTIAVGLFGVYGSLLVLNAHWLSLIQSKVGLELQGRVLATNQMLAMAMMPLGFLTVGPITVWIGERVEDPDAVLPLTSPLFDGAQGAGYGATLLLVGVVLVAWAVVGLLWRQLRTMDSTLPDAVAAPMIDGDKDAQQQAADRRLVEAGSGAG